MMLATRVGLTAVRRGDMLPTTEGVSIADTLSTDHEGVPFWWDTNGQRHFGEYGEIVTYASAVHTQRLGIASTGRVHALMQGERPVCGLTGAPLSVQEASMALASVTCPDCCARLKLAGSFARPVRAGV